MGWAKFDDRYDDGPKVKRAWRDHPRAIGLHSMSITYCARHELDGIVDVEWIQEKIPDRRQRGRCLQALIDAGLFEIHDDRHYRVHDYLDYNPSRAELEERRRKDSERKARGGSNGKPGGIRTDSERNPRGSQADSESPVPSRPVPSPTTTTHTSGEGGTDQGGRAAQADGPSGGLFRSVVADLERRNAA